MTTNRNTQPSKRRRLGGFGTLIAGALVLTACSLPDIQITTGEPPEPVPAEQGNNETINEGGEQIDSTTTTTVFVEPDPGDEEEPKPSNTAELDAHLATLQYNSDDTLNVQEIAGGAPSSRAAGEETTSENRDRNTLIKCTTTPYNLQTNFSEVAILRPTNGVVFPGALVKADSSLLDGVPVALGIPQGPVTLSVDLPGMGDAGVLRVENPTNSSVQAAVDGALGWWNNNAYIDGYVNASNSSYQYKTAYSSEQAALDVGLNVAWATGDFAGRLSIDTESERRTTMATFKQAFYTVSVDTPSSPGAMISPTVETDRAIAALTPANAPAYVASVVYGRILMVRMESSRNVLAVDAEAALNYAAGAKVEGKVNAEYEKILEESTLEVITLGGNAAVQSKLIDPSTLPEVIQGDNAIYSTSNPGVPIAYSVHNLNDNSLAKLGYTTDYTATECSTDQVGSTVKVTLVRFQAVRDCDGVEGDGDFSFGASVLDRNLNTIANSRASRKPVLGDGEYVNLLHEVVFDIEWEEGAAFTVSFTGSEVDLPVIGKAYNDSRMNGANRRQTHIYNPGANSWSNLDPQSTGLGGKWPQTMQLSVGSGNCIAELHYVVDFI